MSKKYILETNQQLKNRSQLTDSECSIIAKIKTTYSWPFWSCLFSKPPYCFLSPRVNSVGSISKCAAIYGFKSASLPKRTLLRFRAISLSSFIQEGEKKSRERERNNRKITVNNMIVTYCQADGGWGISPGMYKSTIYFHCITNLSHLFKFRFRPHPKWAQGGLQHFNTGTDIKNI